jgi:hypothetical protein
MTAKDHPDFDAHQAAMNMLNEIHQRMGIELVYQLKLERLAVDKIAEKHLLAAWKASQQSSIPPEPKAGVELTDVPKPEIDRMDIGGNRVLGYSVAQFQVEITKRDHENARLHNELAHAGLQITSMRQSLNQRQAVKAEPIYLENGLRCKVHDRGLDGGAILGLPESMIGQWVAFVDATDNKHMQKTKPLSAAQGVPEGMALPELDDGLVEILGRPNFHCINLANLLRRSGRDIPRKSEYEQAHVLHFLLSAYLTVGPESWREQIQHECNLMLSAAPEQAESKEGK